MGSELLQETWMLWAKITEGNRSLGFFAGETWMLGKGPSKGTCEGFGEDKMEGRCVTGKEIVCTQA